MSTEETGQTQGEGTQTLIPAGQTIDLALLNAIHLWASATTDAESACRQDLLRSKRQAVSSFFAHCGKHPGEVTALDVQRWRDALEGKGLSPRLSTRTLSTASATAR